MKPQDILYETESGRFFVVAAEFGTGRFKPKSKGFEVYENGPTCAARRAIIGFEGQPGFERAKAEANKREEESQWLSNLK